MKLIIILVVIGLIPSIFRTLPIVDECAD